MNRDDTIRMAREAGGLIYEVDWCFEVENLKRFATLVAAAEREKVAQWMIQRSYATGHGDTIEDLLAELDWQIKERIAIEREACAKLCDNLDDDMPDGLAGWQYGEAIRARGSND